MSELADRVVERLGFADSVADGDVVLDKCQLLSAFRWPAGVRLARRSPCAPEMPRRCCGGVCVGGSPIAGPAVT
jgi:hypothetical protein